MSVATIRCAGQPSRAARRASAPTVTVTNEFSESLTLLAEQIRRTTAPCVQQNSSITEPDSEGIRVPKKTSDWGSSMRDLLIWVMGDLLL